MKVLVSSTAWEPRQNKGCLLPLSKAHIKQQLAH